MKSAPGSSITLSWTPILYTADSGGYNVYYSTSSGGGYTLYDTTADKLASEMEVTGLAIDTTYFFVVQSQTDPHSMNQNTVLSGYSNEVYAATFTDSDLDGFPDALEIDIFGDLAQGPDDDPDNDGYTNLEEYNNQTDPTVDQEYQALVDLYNNAGGASWFDGTGWTGTQGTQVT